MTLWFVFALMTAAAIFAVLWPLSRAGRPQNEVKHGEKGIFEELYGDRSKLEQFMGAMTGLSRINFEAFAAKFDFSKFRTLCDVGGATGLLSIEVAKQHPHLQCISFDLPPVEPIAKKHIAAAGLAGRVATASGASMTNKPSDSASVSPAASRSRARTVTLRPAIAPMAASTCAVVSSGIIFLKFVSSWAATALWPASHTAIPIASSRTAAMLPP